MYMCRVYIYIYIWYIYIYIYDVWFRCCLCIGLCFWGRGRGRIYNLIKILGIYNLINITCLLLSGLTMHLGGI